MYRGGGGGGGVKMAKMLRTYYMDAPLFTVPLFRSNNVFRPLREIIECREYNKMVFLGGDFNSRPCGLNNIRNDNL